MSDGLPTKQPILLALKWPFADHLNHSVLFSSSSSLRSSPAWLATHLRNDLSLVPLLIDPHHTNVLQGVILRTCCYAVVSNNPPVPIPLQGKILHPVLLWIQFCHNLCVFSVKHFNRTKCICVVVYLAFVKVFLVFVKVYLRAKIAGELFLLGGQGCYPADVSWWKDSLLSSPVQSGLQKTIENTVKFAIFLAL